MDYIIFIALVLGFGWYWNKGISPLYLNPPNVPKMARIMVNVFVAAVLVMSVLQAFGIGR